MLPVVQEGRRMDTTKTHKIQGLEEDTVTELIRYKERGFRAKGHRERHE